MALRSVFGSRQMGVHAMAMLVMALVVHVLCGTIPEGLVVILREIYLSDYGPVVCFCSSFIVSALIQRSFCVKI